MIHSLYCWGKISAVCTGQRTGCTPEAVWQWW